MTWRLTTEVSRRPEFFEDYLRQIDVDPVQLKGEHRGTIVTAFTFCRRS